MLTFVKGIPRPAIAPVRWFRWPGNPRKSHEESRIQCGVGSQRFHVFASDLADRADPIRVDAARIRIASFTRTTPLWFETLDTGSDMRTVRFQ